ncbi:MAG TPA: hypothetical protein VFJ16_00835 [Longimicrobium sp.]|nr:hypothetical protein [Longimicrobium sp.]
MIHLARLVLMLAFAFAQAATAECPMASAAHPRAPQTHASAGHPGYHAHGTRTPEHTPDAHDHGAAACVLVMSCGTAAAASAEISVPRPPLAAARPPARAARHYASPHIPIDAPPPRSSVAA